MKPFKLAVRVGSHIFRGEGEEATVQRNFDRFMQLMELNHSTSQNAVPFAEQPEEEEDDRFHQRIFRLTNEGTVSLRHLPTTRDRQFDALVLLLYGYIVAKATFKTVFKDEAPADNGGENCPTSDHSVTSAELLTGAKRSGLECDRVDKVFFGRPETYVLQVGRKRGTRYMLTKAGRDHALKIINEMLERVPEWVPEVGDICKWCPSSEQEGEDGGAGHGLETEE
jgi:hypothetical protein